jgi:hypothetical protein
MFKGYCHISSLTQCYNNFNPLTLLILKKKIYFSGPRARAKKQEYTFASHKYSPILHFSVPHTYTFCAPLTRAEALPHFYINPLSCSYVLLLLATLPPQSPHLASIRFSLLALFGLRQLGCASNT